jgi:hypothetical protein
VRGQELRLRSPARDGAAKRRIAGGSVLVICPTADYEIYLGRNLLPVDQVLFEPTRKLLEVWDEFGIRATLFPDICSVWRHRELGLTDYADAFEKQIREAARAGHDVQLHLHPEWLSATHEDDAWQFAPRTGSLHDLGFDPHDPTAAPALIRRGREYLEGLLRPDDSTYECMAFRAGGWILQPERDLVDALRRSGIRVDATVIPGVQLARRDYHVDFRRAPDKPNWYIGSNSGLKRDSGLVEDLFEIPIGSYRGAWPMWQHVVNELRLRHRAKAHTLAMRGYPIVKVSEKQGALERVRRKFRKLSVPRVFDIADTCESMLTTLESWVRRYHRGSETIAVCMNGHPKDTYDHHLDELRRFHEQVRARYADVVRFEPIASFYLRVHA